MGLETLKKKLPGEKKCILEQVPDSPNNIIDVGCGPGFFTYCLSQAFPQARVVGFDGDAQSVEEASVTHQRDNLEYRFGDIADLEAGAFEVVVMCSVIEHLPNVGQNLRRINALTAPGGTLLLDTDNAYSFKFFLANLFYGYRGTRPSTYKWHEQERYYWWNHHLYSWTLSTLTTLLELYGFSLEGYWYTHHFPGRNPVDRLSDWVGVLVPGLRRHIVVKMKKIGEPVIVERTPGTG
jgi:2-polyprenyl-3-methyl-5-hydroxy-6-metoxy-1,4-benzoquinol methylase